MRPYIRLLELPMYQSNHNLFLGLSSVLGLIGGAYLLQCGAQRLLSKIVDKKKEKKENGEELQSCNVCGADLDTSSVKNYVTCCTCGKFVCRGIKCADWRPKDAQWECELCHSSKQSLAHTSSWVAEQMCFNQQKFVYPLRARSEVYIPITDSSMQFESVSQAGANSMTNMTGEERNRIREYVEEIVAEMLGSNLDHIKVGQLSKSENYMQLFDRYHAKLSNLLINVENALCARALKGDLPAIVNGNSNNNNNNNNTNSSNNNSGNNNELSDISQTRLRNLIESIIAETLRTGANTLGPSAAVSEISLDTRSTGQLSNGNKRRHRTEHYFEPKIYQDLLATAVLNKIADKEGNARLISESTPDLSGHNIDENYNAEALSTTSGSSIEPRSDCSLTDNELLLNAGKTESHAGLKADLQRESVLSDYIAAHMVPLPDFSASVTESEDDIPSMSSSMVGDATWEDNWLFKKKRSTLQSSATPSSIGMLVPAPKENVRAQIGDRTADEVSDLSEIGSDAEESSLDLLRCNDLNDRLLSKHLIGGQNTKLVLDELVDRTSLTSNTLPEEHEPAITETTNTFVTQPSTISVPKEQMAPPPPMSFQDDQENEDPAQTLIAGSIAEREVKKWYNAVEMPNNPYAPEALKQRISGTQERFMDVPNISPSVEQKALAQMTTEIVEPASRAEDYKRYSRDYYINDAPSESSKAQSLAGSVSASACSMEPTTAPTDEDIVINEASNANKNAADASCVYTAMPVQVIEEGNASLETQSNPSMQSQHTTSDDSDTVRIYDFNNQETRVISKSETVGEQPSTSSTLSMESALSAPSASSSSIDASRKRERPVVLQFGPADAVPTVCSSPTMTPTRGSTPPAFRFLQPKRRLIEPSQVLSIDEDEVPEPSTPVEKPPIEDEVAHAMPSVKALAQAFLLTSKRTQPERRWRKTVRLIAPPETPEKPSTPVSRRHMLQHAVSMAEVADESTIASDLSSLETDPSIHSESQPSPIPVAAQASPVPVRRGFLRSNIAFFENLKFK
ncbi:general transcriptional corepressor trfA isoform X6 [Drosophila sulfurigaster albostrigata]|uniref:general transcriptional corepressor trfA isoform X6 n=1 Tax=Drosophila sulfurigaster albostrigata TaxID=89887 RepID=UPI002D2198C3|nr:general transcriptional corepressor trfA isoform X6 [Drosophila sulfurigaster albostrigata]